MKQILLICAVVALVGCGTTSWVSDPSDPNNVRIEKAIRAELKKPEGELTKADLKKVVKLNLFNRGISDLTTLKEMPNLKELNLERNKISDLTPLSELTNLEQLFLYGNRIKDLSPLKNLQQLKGLKIGVNSINDISPLQGLTKLESLGFIVNSVKDLKPLSGLTNLKQLVLNDNPALTKAQIDELRKALPNCKISSNPKK